MSQTQASEEAKKLRDRLADGLRARGVKPMTEDEYRRAIEPPRCDPHCKECGGTGYVLKAPAATIYDRDFGKVRICSVYGQRLLKERLARGEWDRRTGLEPIEVSMTWDLVKPKLSDAMKALKAVKPRFEAGHGFVLLIGPFGQGKTLIGKILVAESCRRGITAAYANMAMIIDDIRMAFDSQEAKSTELVRRMDWWNGLDVLFIDELDKMNRTDWAQERMFELLDRRYTRAIRQEALTVVATNAAIEALDGYLQSRLQDNRLGPIVELQGPDGRLSMPAGHKF